MSGLVLVSGYYYLTPRTGGDQPDDRAAAMSQ
jgi:hypothetical protein